MSREKCLIVKDTNNPDNPRLCVEDINGYWIEYTNRKKDYTEIKIHEHLPEEFIDGVCLDPDEVEECGFEFMGTNEICFFDILTCSNEVNVLKLNVANAIETLRELIEHKWEISSVESGIIYLPTQLVYVEDYFDEEKGGSGDGLLKPCLRWFRRYLMKFRALREMLKTLRKNQNKV